MQVLQWSDAAFFYAPTGKWLRPDHFVQRLTPAKVQVIICRVIRNAESANADPSRDFIIESLGIFGSVLTAGATSPGDVDVVFTARWRSNNRPLPEASYYPFGVSEPTNRVSRALSRGSRRMDLSSHYLLEVERLGAPYRIIWTRDEGCVDRPIITPKKRRSKHVSVMKLPDADAFTDSFRARCASLPPLLPPQAPSLPRSTYQMSHSEWLAILDDKHPVVDLAHSLCLPRGELKEKVSSMVAERFQMHSDLKTEAQKMLGRFLLLKGTVNHNGLFCCRCPHNINRCVLI